MVTYNQRTRIHRGGIKQSTNSRLFVSHRRNLFLDSSQTCCGSSRCAKHCRFTTASWLGLGMSDLARKSKRSVTRRPAVATASSCRHPTRYLRSHHCPQIRRVNATRLKFSSQPRISFSTCARILRRKQRSDDRRQFFITICKQ